MSIQHFLISAAAEAVQNTSQPSFVQTLGLNWKLFLAQLVNFGIVLFILWKWVMKPVVGALETRRDKIEASVRQAEEIEKRMKAFEEDRQEQIRKTKAEAEEILKKATALGESARTETVALAKAEADKIMAQTRSAITAEKEQLLKDIREEVADLTVLATEKILRQKLAGQKDRELVEEVLKGIK